jgi:hypothetical protein
MKQQEKSIFEKIRNEEGFVQVHDHKLDIATKHFYFYNSLFIECLLKNRFFWLFQNFILSFFYSKKRVNRILLYECKEYI